MYEILKKQGVLPLITKVDINTAEIIMKSASDTGIKIIEYAARSADSIEVFSRMIDFKRKHNLDLKLCVGSVLTVNDAKLYHNLGADCIVCPHTDVEIGNYCIENNLYWIPGAATLNEVLNANKLGAEIVKLFPADKIGGADYVKAIKAPFPNLKLMPTGGVTLEEKNLKSWFKSGVVCVGIGSNLFSKETLAQIDYEKSCHLFRHLTEMVGKSRN
jgi:2-dehydro-3-deoxyphosphogluconate aldolase/(4S)-4-hydroxy-2-oxoglutarate aldolase